MSRDEQGKVTFLQIARPIEASRLEELKTGKKYGEVELQEFYRDIWTILSFLYPCADNGVARQGETRISVKSEVLIKFGVVPEWGVTQIQQKRARREEVLGDLGPGDEPENWGVIKRGKIETENSTLDGFTITKTYMAEYSPSRGHKDSHRLDVEIKEVSLLFVNGEGKYCFSQQTNKPKSRRELKVDHGVHSHLEGHKWVVANSGEDRIMYEETDISTRSLVRTLVFLVEGISPRTPEQIKAIEPIKVI